MVGDPVRAKKVSDILLAEYGVYVQPINFPTVPRGTERLRFTPGPQHTREMMVELTQALIEIWQRLELEKAPRCLARPGCQHPRMRQLPGLGLSSVPTVGAFRAHLFAAPSLICPPGHGDT